MKKLLAVTLVIILALGLSATALAEEVPAPIVRKDTLSDGSRDQSDLLAFHGEDGVDYSKIVKVHYSWDITNWDDFEAGGDPALWCIINSAPTGWDQGEPVTLTSGKGSYIRDVTGVFSNEDGYIEATVSYWGKNPLPTGTITITMFTAEQWEIAQTGVLSFIGIAGAVLAASGTGAVIAGRKLKKSK